MDYGLLNALGISVMMIFGLWAYHKGYQNRHKKREKGLDKKNHLQQKQDL